jgi:hypothetical protein
MELINYPRRAGFPATCDFLLLIGSRFMTSTLCLRTDKLKDYVGFHTANHYWLAVGELYLLIFLTTPCHQTSKKS